MGDQLIRAGGACWLQLNKGHGCFAPFGVGFGDHGARLNAGVAVEGVFYFNGADVLATRNNDVFATVFDLDVAVCFHHGEVARMEPPALEGGIGRRRVF